MSAMTAIIKAVVDRMKADTGVDAVIGDRVWEGSAPAGTQKPMATVDSPTESVRRHMGGLGYSDTVLIHVHSALDAVDEIAVVIPAINAAFATPLDLGALGIVLLKYESGLILPDGNGRTAPLRYRAVAYRN